MIRKDPLAKDKKEALLRYAKEHGHSWKRDLAEAWNAGDSLSGPLAQIRDEYGQEWLDHVSISPKFGSVYWTGIAPPPFIRPSRKDLLQKIGQVAPEADPVHLEACIRLSYSPGTVENLPDFQFQGIVESAVRKIREFGEDWAEDLAMSMDLRDNLMDPDSRPGNYYVVARKTSDANAPYSLLTGPFCNDHFRAFLFLSRSRKIALERFSDSERFEFQTARFPHEETRPGILNADLGLDDNGQDLAHNPAPNDKQPKETRMDSEYEHDSENFDGEGLDIALGNARKGAKHHVFVREEHEDELFELESSFGGKDSSEKAESLRRLMGKSGKECVVIDNAVLRDLLDTDEEIVEEKPAKKKKPAVHP